MNSQLDNPANLCYTVYMADEGAPLVEAESWELQEPDGINLQDETGQQALLSRIPHLKGGTRTAALKADYLGYRATGFPIRQACYLADINHSTLVRWRASDSEFADIETNRIQELQANVGGDLIRLEFLRNMRLGLRTDFKVLYTAVHNLEGLTDRQFKYLQRIRSLYSPQDLLAISKALSPESETPTDFAELVLSITKTRMEVRVAKETNKPPQDTDIIEGESSPK